MQENEKGVSVSVRSWVEISRRALRANVRRVRECMAPGTGILAVVKANAYGHGIDGVVPELAPEVQWFGVACLHEAERVRSVAAGHPILILGPVLPSERASVLRQGFVPVLSNWEEALGFDAEADALGLKEVCVHVAVDTGMGRIGVWEEEAVEFMERMRGLRRVRVGGLGTHFPSADEDGDFTRAQIVRFGALVQRGRVFFGPGLEVHAANSAGVLGYAVNYATLARPGLVLYGTRPVSGGGEPYDPVMSWKARVVLVREVGAGRSVSYGRTFLAQSPLRVATVAVGYADGYPRSLSGRGAEVLVRGRRCPVLGRVTMDQILVDVSLCGGVEPGETAVLIGRQGGEEILVEELAARAGSIPWEIFTGVGDRVERWMGDA